MRTKVLLVFVFFSAFFCRQTGENDDEVNADNIDDDGDDDTDYTDDVEDGVVEEAEMLRQSASRGSSLMGKKKLAPGPRAWMTHVNLFLAMRHEPPLRHEP